MSVWPGHPHPEGGMRVTLKKSRFTNKKHLRHPFNFQIAPMDEFGFDSSHNWIDYDTIEAGQFSREAGPQLATIAFNTLVVDYNPAWAVWAGGSGHIPEGSGIPGAEPAGEAPNPQQVSDDLWDLQRAGTPFRLVAHTHQLWDEPDIDSLVTLRSLSSRERAGEPDARYFDLTFMEYRPQRLHRRKYGRGHGGGAKVVRVYPSGAVEELIEGKPNKILGGYGTDHMTLRKLAKHYYGDAGKWRAIARRNGIDGFGPDENVAHLDKAGRPDRKLIIPPEGNKDN